MNLQVKLHEHQSKANDWLMTLYKDGKSGILADEMGLGKTLSSIAFISHLLQAKPSAGYLVIVPLSIVNTWQDQLTRFAPSISFITYRGCKQERMDMHGRLNTYDLVITTFETVLHDIAVFQRLTWHLIVVDEAHRLKNAKSKLYDMLSESLEMQKAFKLLLTGTPIHNNLSELYSLLSFANPSVFPLHDAEEFTKTYRSNEEALQVKLKPYLLARRVKDVAIPMPPLTEIIIKTKLSPMQKEYYRKILEKDILALGKVNGSKVLNNVLSQLRKACNHPYLFDGAEPEPFQEGDHLWKNSGKLRLLHQLLPKLHQEKHRVLMFSQSTAMLDIVQDFLDWIKYSYERLDGSCRGDDRFNAIERFTKSDEKPFVFLLSTRAGGMGLNLQEADTVVFLDSDYNPQMDLQALARAYRVGQENHVRVFRLITADSVEEIILQRANRKLKLSKAILESEETQETDSPPLDLTHLLQYGLCKVTKDEDVQDDPIDEIIQRSEKRVSTHDNIYLYEGQDYRQSQLYHNDTLAYEQLKQAALDTKRKRNEPCTMLTLPETKKKRKQLSEKEREDRKLKRWEVLGYRSTALVRVPDVIERSPVSIVYCKGDATQPQCDVGRSMILQCIDNSGIWCQRGFFRALSKLSDEPKNVYTKAGTAKDLKLGQVHEAEVNEKILVELLVAQKRLSGKKARVAKVSDVHLDLLDECLRTIASRALELEASVHVPRFGTRTAWYSIERLLRKHLTARGVSTYVYYYCVREK